MGAGGAGALGLLGAWVLGCLSAGVLGCWGLRRTVVLLPKKVCTNGCYMRVGSVGEWNGLEGIPPPSPPPRSCRRTGDWEGLGKRAMHENGRQFLPFFLLVFRLRTLRTLAALRLAAPFFNPVPHPSCWPSHPTALLSLCLTHPSDQGLRRPHRRQITRPSSPSSLNGPE